MFINFQEKTEANFNEVKTELKEIGSKIDGLVSCCWMLVTCVTFFIFL